MTAKLDIITSSFLGRCGLFFLSFFFEFFFLILGQNVNVSNKYWEMAGDIYMATKDQVTNSREVAMVVCCRKTSKSCGNLKADKCIALSLFMAQLDLTRGTLESFLPSKNMPA